MTKLGRTRDEVLLFNMFDLPMARGGSLRLLGGVDNVLLSEDGLSGSATYLARIPAGWAETEDAAEATVELFLLDGDMEVLGEHLGVGGYVCLPQGSGGSDLSSPRGTLTLVFWNPNLPAFPPPYTVPRAVRSWKEPLRARDANSLESTFRSLRLPDFNEQGFNGGPGGFLRLSYLAPGMASPYQHVHHENWEEAILLAGDLLIADRGVLGSGSYVAFPQEFWHGVLATQAGVVMLVQTNAPMGYPWVLRDYPIGHGVVEEYLDSQPFGSPPEHRPWAETPYAASQESPAFREWLSGAQSQGWADVVGRGGAWAWRRSWKRRL